MIWMALIFYGAGIMNWFLDFMPMADPQVTGFIVQGSSNLKYYLAKANWIMPVDTLATVFKLAMIVLLANVVFKIVHWAVKTLSGGVVK